MAGELLTRMLRGVLHHNTFELFVSPAIADLQRCPSTAAYLAVWSSLGGAVVEDLILDAQLLVDEIGLMLGLIAMQTCYYGGMLLLLVADVRGDQIMARLSQGMGVVTLTLFAL